MRPHVVQMFPRYSVDLEGICDHMYVDRKRLVTAGVGNLCEPIQLALRFPWMMGERRATVEEVTADWHAINSREEQLWNTVAAKQAQYTRVRLTEDAIDAMVLRQLTANINYARENFFPLWDTFSSDAHLALASTMWALGAGIDKRRPGLVRAANNGDWVAAKHHAHLEESNNPGVIERNRRQDICFDNAATVATRGLDPELLFWPNRAPKEDDLRTMALKAVELGIARESEKPKA